jgi:hypothetical protein
MCSSWASSTWSLPSWVRARWAKDIENQTGTVDHATLENTFEVTFLTGREGVIENHQVGFFGIDQVAQLLDLAAANQEFGGWPMTRHVKKRNGLGAGRSANS